jgi:hypothetical protein
MPAKTPGLVGRILWNGCKFLASCWFLRESTATNLTTLPDLGRRRCVANALKIRSLRSFAYRTFRCLGHGGSSKISSAKSIAYEAQVVESSGFDQLQSIYKRPCLCDRCAGKPSCEIAQKSSMIPFSMRSQSGNEWLQISLHRQDRPLMMARQVVHSIEEGR